MSAYTFEDLVAAATVGVAQRDVAITGLAGPAGEYAELLPAGDPAGAVLAATALLTAARRAGQVPGQVGTLPPAAPADPVPEPPPTLAALLAEAVRLNDAEALAGLLTATTGAGMRAPAPLLPALFDAAPRDPALRAAVIRAAGTRGRWLAALNPAWHALLPDLPAGAAGVGGVAEAGPASAGSGGAGSGGADPAAGAGPARPGLAGAEVGERWLTGTRAERVAYLVGVRERDAGAGRELLAAGWAREGADDRRVLVGALRTGLSPADEAFLEAALDDRAGSVRAAAVRLLAVLPGSAFQQRATARGEGLLRVEGRGRRRRLVVTPPEEAVGAPRDGVSARSPSPRFGPRVWLLMQLIAATPLAVWTRRLHAEPEELTALPVEDDFADNVHAGWRSATVREADPRWAAALLTAARTLDPRPRPRGGWSTGSQLAAALPPGWPSAFELATLLPRADRVAYTIGLLGRDSEDDPEAAEAAAGCPAPWPLELARAALDHLARTIDWRSGSAVDPVLPALARRVDPGIAAGLADRLRPLSEGPRAHGRWAAELGRAADIIELRRRFHEELS